MKKKLIRALLVSIIPVTTILLLFANHFNIGLLAVIANGVWNLGPMGVLLYTVMAPVRFSVTQKMITIGMFIASIFSQVIMLTASPVLGGMFVWILVGLFAIMITLGLLKRKEWNLRTVDRLKSTGVYLLLKKPKSLLELLSCVFGVGLCSMDILCKDENKYIRYGFSKKDGEFKGDFSTVHVKNEQITYIKIHDNVKVFRNKILQHSLLGKKYNLIKRNCLTIWRPIFKDLKIGGNALFPSTFVKRYLKQKNVEATTIK